MGFENHQEVFESRHWKNIEKEVLTKIKPITSLGVKIKLVSELISELTEKTAAKYFSDIYKSDNIISATNDNQPDIVLNNNNIEIKVSKVTQSGVVSWRGGKYSKREGTFILICWDFDENNPEEFLFAVYKAELNKTDWVISKYDNYYATIYTLDLLVKNPTHLKVVGDIKLSKRGIVKPVLESIV